ncbi:ArsR/SmtB family transcription factor [Herbaspirillum chlorophenolicum]|uniref:ArsR/SmtB family transcription factor n=1 Tax=Herbaspirillum chlorophenolicum TaxID=211589 RepID=UPI0009E5CE57|nr:helix-turn-helix domain-containing protein [Herbaspirillum chlorophenolicum]
MTDIGSKNAVKLLSALAQESRLDIYRHLVELGPEGCSTGELRDRLGIPGATLSFHLKELVYAGLLTSVSKGRFVFYQPDFSVMNGLLHFLTENCCNGEPCQICVHEGADTAATSA